MFLNASNFRCGTAIRHSIGLPTYPQRYYLPDDTYLINRSRKILITIVQAEGITTSLWQLVCLLLSCLLLIKVSIRRAEYWPIFRQRRISQKLTAHIIFQKGAERINLLRAIVRQVIVVLTDLWRNSGYCSQLQLGRIVEGLNKVIGVRAS